MISFKNNQNKPLLDYYLETDLDNFDDQPVDYSKKYADQDSYEDCRRTKSVLKTDEFPNEVSQTIKQSCNDEVKVYCLEGTPLTISSASSFCDLREVGTSNTVVGKSGMKSAFSSVNDGVSSDTYEVDIKKNSESSRDKEVVTSPSEEKDEMKEGKSVSFRNSNEISKASSPLMFSRSSSIASLNSFEQQSIVDDRSSVSVFSALTSGLISPSDLPDSPGEVMSPAFTDKDSSPKIDVTKSDCNSECGNIEFSEKDKVAVEKVENNDTHSELSGHVELLKTKGYVPVDTYKPERNSEDDGDILVEHLEVSNDSIDTDEVFDNHKSGNSSFSVQNEDTEMNKEADLLNNGNVDEKENVVKSCGEEGISKQFSETHDEIKPLDVTKSVDDSDEDDELLNRCIQLGMPESTPTRPIKNSEECVETLYLPHSTGYNCEEDELKTFPSDIKSLEDSDNDEDDELLERCIQLGMPENTSNGTTKSTEGCIKTQYLPHSVGFNCKNVEIHKKNVEEFGREENVLKHIQEGETSKAVIDVDASATEIKMKKLDVRKSVECSDDDDEDDELLNNCIQLGMPENTPNRKIKSAEGHVKAQYLPQPNDYNCRNDVLKASGAIKSVEDSDDDEDDELLQRCIQLGMPENTSNRTIKTEEGCVKTQYVAHSTDYNCRNDLYVPPCAKCDDDYGGDDILLQQCIQLGMPSKPSRDKDPRHVYKRTERHCVPLKSSTSWQVQVNNESKSNEPLHCTRNRMSSPCMQYGMPYKLNKSTVNTKPMNIAKYQCPAIKNALQNDRRDNCPDGISDGDEDDEMLAKCIRAGMPGPKPTSDIQPKLYTSETGNNSRKSQIPIHPFLLDTSTDLNKKFCHPRLPQNQPYAPIHSSTTWLSNTSFIDVDSMRIYRTEDTPILSPSASISDLSSLSFNESFLNNSRNSDCTSDSDDDDELLLRCIRSGMPEARRAVA